MKLNLKRKEKRKKQVLVNTLPERVKLLMKINGRTLEEAFTSLGLQDLKTVFTEGREGAEIAQLCLITPTEELLIPYSRSFAEDRAFETASELESGEFHIANRRNEEDPDDGPFTGEPYISFGYEAKVAVLREESLTEDEEDEKPKKKVIIGEEGEE